MYGLPVALGGESQRPPRKVKPLEPRFPPELGAEPERPRDTVSRGQKHRLPVIPRDPFKNDSQPPCRSPQAQRPAASCTPIASLQWQTTRSLGVRYASAPPGPLILTLTADPSYSIRPPRRRRGTPFTPQPPPSALGPAARSEPAPHRETPPPPPPERRRTELPSRSLLSPPLCGPPFSTT